MRVYCARSGIRTRLSLGRLVLNRRTRFSLGHLVLSTATKDFLRKKTIHKSCLQALPGPVYYMSGIFKSALD